MTRADLSRATGLSLEGVKKNIRLLRKQGLLRRVGPSKGGHWEVIGSGKEAG
jgi:ATP-dependent DNA helicase RecG